MHFSTFPDWHLVTRLQLTKHIKQARSYSS